MDTPAAERAVFLRSGEFWTIGSGGLNVHIKDSKGLSYIAKLLRNPGVEMHALDLIGAAVGEGTDDPAGPTIRRRRGIRAEAGLNITGLGDAGEMLDAQSKAAYRRRLDELQEDLETAQRRADPEAASRAEDEIDALRRELSRAVGLGGRDRRASSAAERARVSVTKAIKLAIEKIAQHRPALALELARSIQTGFFCSYTPAADASLLWEVDSAESDPAADPAETGPGSPAESVIPLILKTHRTSFVGRDAERHELMAAFEAAGRGAGSIVMLQGGPGVGKTRLALEGARQAVSHGAMVLFGRCYDEEEPHPYSPFVEMIEDALRQVGDDSRFRRALGENAAELAQMAPRLRHVFSDIPAPMQLPPEQARRFLFDSLCTFLERSAETRPVFLILDDLQWADHSTLSLLLHLARKIALLKVLLVVTYRDAEADRSPALARSLEEMIRGNVRSIRLRGLPESAVTSMIRALANSEPPPQLVAAIYQETGGNPFFVEELFRYLAEEGKIPESRGALAPDVRIAETEVPENIRLVVGRRLDRLSGAARRMLAVAAAIGREFSFRLLESIDQERTDNLLNSIEEVLRSGLVVAAPGESDETLNFSHELVRQAVLSRLAPPRRRRLHVQVADAIEKLHPLELEARAGEIVHHLVQAGSEADPARTARYLTIAGEHALAAAAFEDALRHFEGALQRASALDSRSYAQLLSDIGMAERSLGRWDDARSHWQKSLDLYASIGDGEAVGRLSATIVESLGWGARYLEAAQFAFRALEQLQDSVTGDRARLLGMVGAIQAASGAYQAASGALAQAVWMAEQSGDIRALGEVLSYRSFHNFVFLRIEDCIADGFRGAEILRQTGSLWSLAQLLGFLQRALFKAGRLEEAERVNAEIEPLARKLGHDGARMVHIRASAWNEFSKNADLGRLEEWFTREQEIMQAASLGWTSSTYALFALVEFMRGNWDASLARSEKAYAEEFNDAFSGYGAGMLLRMRAYLGDREGALALLEKRRDWLPRLDRPSPVGNWGFLTLVIESLWVMGEFRLAAELYPLARKATESGTRIFLMTSRSPFLTAAIAAAAGDDWQRAEEHFKLAIQVAHEIPNRPEQPEARRFYAEALIRRGRPEDRTAILDLLNEALDAYQHLAMRRHAELTKALLARLPH